jgi:hypothetical protein
MKTPTVKILVCSHKSDVWKADDIYMPLHVGKAISNENLGIQGDDTGDNISVKNKNYCELTGLYWAWKNLKNVDYIGLCHYRRYFNFHTKGTPFSIFSLVKSDEVNNLNLSLPDINKLFNKYDVILAKSKIYPVSIFDDYCLNHVSEDARVIEKIILEKYPEYKRSINECLHNSNKLSHYNMFIMRWEDFHKYCSWLFSILEEAERRIDISGYNNAQKRIWGYVSERLLLSLFVYHNNMHAKKYPVYWVNDSLFPSSSFFSRCQKHLRMKLAFEIMKHRKSLN